MNTAENTVLYLVRHGVTQGNVDGVREGLEEEPLLPEGREQARRLAERVRALPVQEVWTSPLPRARQTAEIVAEACDLPLYVDADLRELDAGPWQGLTSEEIADRYPEPYRRWEEDPAAFQLPGRETLGEVQRRVVAALERIRARGRCALVVTHTAPIRLARVHYAGEHLNCFATFLPEHCTLLRLGGPEGQERLRPLD